ncbi:MAG: hypothetical protein ACRDD7_14930, partial [Peptostreptococcaceae bacterium]
MTTKLKAILLAFILVFSNISTTVFAATSTRKLESSTRKIYTIKTGVKNRDELAKKYFNRKVSDIKKEVYHASAKENSKYTSAYNNTVKVYDYFKSNFNISSFDSKGSTLFVFPNFKLKQAFS